MKYRFKYEEYNNKKRAYSDDKKQLTHGKNSLIKPYIFNSIKARDAIPQRGNVLHNIRPNRNDRT